MTIGCKNTVFGMKKAKLEISYGKQSESDKDYRDDCLRLTPAERLASVQTLRVAFWGDEATTGRVQRIPEFIKRSKG